MTASDDRTPLIIRAPAPGDEGAWRRLWSGYCAFYETKVSEAVTAGTWARMLTPGSPLFGRIAEWEGQVAGFIICVIHEGSWTLRPCCYLEDLFVAPDFRGRRIGHALIEELLQLCRQQGWARLYWHTRGGNRQARRLYDKFGAADDFVRYRLSLD